jgi:hypothetical protein
MDATKLLADINDADPGVVISRLAEIEAEQKSLRELLRLIKRTQRANAAARREPDAPTSESEVQS